MKQLGFLIFMLSLLFCSCNNNKETDLEIELPINSTFIPVSIDINTAEIGEKEREDIMNLVNNGHVVNDVSELPSDPIGKNEAFYSVNFNENTLLIAYLFKKWSLDTYSNRFYKNTEENSFNWVVRIGSALDYDDDPDVVSLTRFAILVRKLPVDAKVQTWYSFSQLGS